MSQEYKKAMEDGEKAVSNKQYEKAVENFSIAVKEEPTDSMALIKLENAKLLVDFEKAKVTIEDMQSELEDLRQMKAKYEEIQREREGMQSELKILREVNEKYQQIQREQKQKQEKLQEKRNNPIEIKITSFYDGYSVTTLEGEIKNVSDLTLKSVKIRVLFKDDDDNIIDSSETYADSGTILPNAMTKFKTYVTKDSRITKASASIVDYRTE